MAAGALIAVGSAWLGVVALLVLDVAGLRHLRGAGRRWQGAGILLIVSGVLISSLAGLRGWPPAMLHRVHSALLVLVGAGIIVLAAGLGIAARSGHGTSRS